MVNRKDLTILVLEKMREEFPVHSPLSCDLVYVSHDPLHKHPINCIIFSIILFLGPSTSGIRRAVNPNSITGKFFGHGFLSKSQTYISCSVATKTKNYYFYR